MSAPGRRRGVTTLVVALVLAAPLALAAAVTADDAGAETQAKQKGKKKAKVKKRGGLVLAPRTGRTYRAGPLHVLVRARSRDRVRLILNGTVTAGGHSRIDHARLRKLRISPNHGLRHGRNVLRVRVKRRGAKRARTQVVRFRVVGKAPLAAAGRDRSVAAHARIRLNGRQSLLHPLARRGGGRLRHQWRILRAPRGSKLAKGKQRKRRRAGSSARKGGKGQRIQSGVVNLGAPPLFSGRGSIVPRFRADRPGSYLIELSVTGPRGTVAKDVVEVEVNPDPMVTIDTMAKPEGQKSWGVRVGTQFYPDPGDSKKWLQVVALESDSLELISNTAYDCPEATANPFATARGLAAVERCNKQLAADLSKLRDRYKGKEHPPLLIAVSQRVPGSIQHSGPWEAQPPVGVMKGLNAFVPGIVLKEQGWLHFDEKMLRGRFSLIGTVYPGASTFHMNRDLSDLRDDGEIVGALLRDNRREYVPFASFEHLPFDTQAAGSDATKNVMLVGGQTYTVNIPAGSRGGFHVTLVERQDLAGVSYWIDTSDKSLEALERTRENLDGMQKAIEGFEDNGHGYLVLVASRGDTRLGATTTSETGKADPLATWAAVQFETQKLVSFLALRVGANTGRVFRALSKKLAGPHSYTLVAEFGSGPARGIEAEAPAPTTPGRSLSTAPLAGTLTRGKARGDYGFDVEAWQVGEEQISTAARKLRELALSPPGPWPERGNGGRTAAIAWIAAQTGLDPRRGHFWTNPPNFNWDAKIESIGKLSFPAGEKRFAKGDFEWAQSELSEEIRWFKTARGTVADLAQPFKGSSAADQWALFTSIASKVNSEVKVPPKNLTGAEVGLFMEGALSVVLAGLAIGGGEGGEKGAEAVHAAVELIEIGAEWAQLENEQGGEVSEHFDVAVGELGEELQSRLKAAQRTLENQLLFVVAADYRKLRTLALCTNLDPVKCPAPPLKDWQTTEDGLHEVEEALEEGTREFVTGALMAAKYSAWEMPRSKYSSVRAERQPGGGDQFDPVWHCPFHDLPDTAQVSLPLSISLGLFDDTWRVLAYAERTGTGNYIGPADPYVMNLPGKSVTDPLFKSRSEHGLGLDRESFFWRYMASKTQKVEHFPHRGSPFEWISKDSPIGVKDGCGW